MAVNQERMGLLIARLESGEDKQGQNLLEQVKEDGTFARCCLGVACRVAIENGLEVEVEVTEKETFFDGSSEILPHTVMKWYGLTEENPAVFYLGQEHPIATLNDGEAMLEVTDPDDEEYGAIKDIPALTLQEIGQVLKDNFITNKLQTGD